MIHKVINLLTKKWILLLIALVIILVGFKYYNNQQHINSLKKEVDTLHKKIEVAQNKNEKLNEELKHVNDPEYIEQMAREKLGLVKPGEVLLVPVQKEQKKQKEQSDK